MFDPAIIPIEPERVEKVAPAVPPPLVLVSMEMMFTPSPAPPPEGTEITTEPPEIPTEAIPAPAKTRLERACVPVLLCVVFDVAYIVTAVPPPPAPTERARFSPAVFMVMDPEIFVPAKVVPVPAYLLES